MSQLTRALSDAGKQAASSPPAAATGATAPAQPAAAGVDHGTLAVESPP